MGCVVLLVILGIILSAGIISANSITGQIITGEVITGKATSSIFNVSIQVIGPPTLALNTPRNSTYIFSHNIPLNYSVSGAQAVWYKIDNESNISISNISSQVLFNTTIGSHNLSIYANSSLGDISTKNVSFAVNISLFNISYNEYSNSSTKGNSTDFSHFSFDECQNLSSITLEHISFGKMFFSSAINLTTISGTLLDLDLFTNISNNHIEINSSALPNFNISAQLTIYNLSLTNPRIIFNGVECPASICTEESYTGGTFKFNVTHFSTFSAEETPSDTGGGGSSGSSGGGGGGGGGGAGIPTPKKNISLSPPISSFSIDKEKISLSLKQGQTKKENLIIKNTGTEKLMLSIKSERITNMIKLSDNSIVIEPGTSKTIALDFIAREDISPDIYLGKIIIENKKEVKEILIAITVSSKQALFDVVVEIPRRYRAISPGEEIIANIKIYNLGEARRANSVMKYIIKNTEGEIIYSDEETIAVETQEEIIKSFQIRQNIPLDNYVLYVEAVYEGTSAGASAWFSVSEKTSENTYVWIIMLLSILAIIILSIVFWSLKKRSSILQAIALDKKTIAQKRRKFSK
mgnify:CR=1 FL=1